MAKIYCEFCGAVASANVQSPRRLIGWTKRNKNVVRCRRHTGASKLARDCRTYNPYTGEHRGINAGKFNLLLTEIPED